MNLNDVHRQIHKHKTRKRVGRGKGSGLGKTSGRGHKGQGQVAGWSQHPGFEGGQLPLYRRIPKRGFNNRWALVVKHVNLNQLEESCQAGEEVSPERLVELGLVSGRFDCVKVLARGELTKKLRVVAHRFSEAARKKIEAAGGEAVVLPGKAPVPKNRMAAAK